MIVNINNNEYSPIVFHGLCICLSRRDFKEDDRVLERWTEMRHTLQLL